MVYSIDRNFNITSFLAFQKSLILMKQCKPNFLVAIGDDVGQQGNETLKIWNLDKVSNNTEEIQLIKTQKIFTKKFSPITTIEVNQDFTIIALGLKNGDVLLFQGDLSRGKGGFLKPIQGYNNEPISGISFLRNTNTYFMFVSNSKKVFSCEIDYKGNFSENTIIDEKGCELNCSTISSDGEFIIGTKDGIFDYTQDTIGGASLLEGNFKI
jgi:vacuolar protein sorting-associated protein 11